MHLGRYTLGWRGPAALASGLLMSASFAPLEQAGLAWIALVPLLKACEGQTIRRAALLGFVAGAVYWLTSIHWITHVTTAGWIVLALYCALYHVPAALFAAVWPPELRGRVGGRLAFVAGGAAVWTASEYLRSTLFTGFAWDALGASQWRNVILLQHAEWGGVYALSFLVAFVNFSALTILRPPRSGSRRRLAVPSVEVLAALALVLAAAGTGWSLFRRVPENDARVRIAMIQPAVPQDVKWTPEFTSGVYARLAELTRLAAVSGPDLIVWPETAVPEDLRESAVPQQLVAELTRNAPPLLAGALAMATREDGSRALFNASYLVRDGGVIATEYDKQHLVIFGEYVPLVGVFPWLRRLVPMDYDIEPGTDARVFELARPPLRFSTTICFEDTVAPLAGAFVRRGARLLINQTNDAWFDFSPASRQHLAHSVLRAVECRVPVARCGNSGVTAWIDERGRLRDRLAHYNPGPSLNAGFLQAEIPFRTVPVDTFHLRHPGLFALLCLNLGTSALAFALARAYVLGRGHRTAAAPRGERE